MSVELAAMAMTMDSSKAGPLCSGLPDAVF